MTEQAYKPGIRISPFSYLIIFVVLALVGASLAFQLPVTLFPDNAKPTLSVRCNWRNSSKTIIEKEITTPLENGLSTIAGLRKITSSSSNGSAIINLEFDKHSNLAVSRFEAQQIVRQIYPKLPPGTSFPLVSNFGNPNRQTQTLMSYTISGSLPDEKLYFVAENIVKQKLVQIDGITDVSISGFSPNAWYIAYDFNYCNALGITDSDISNAITTYYQKNNIGVEKSLAADSIVELRFIVLKMADMNVDDWHNIAVKRVGNKVVYLGEITSFESKAEPSSGYFRINGKNTLNISITASTDQNQIKLSDKVKSSIAEIEKRLSKDVQLILDFDRSEYLSKEISKNSNRTYIATGILLLFIIITSLSIRYTLLILLSLIVNLLIAFGMYKLMGLGIHLYSLAGITLSFGMVIDNTIVMADHLTHRGDKRIFLALLASTLTTVAALSVVWFMPDEYRLNLTDFSTVVIVNLMVSLAVALWFIPALVYFILPKKTTISLGKTKCKRLRIKVLNRYASVLHFFIQRKWMLYTALILGFGIPLYLLPTPFKEQGFWATCYNNTLGSNLFRSVQNVVEPYLGGALRLFVKNAKDTGVDRDPQRTMLHISSSMPDGATMAQMNEAMRDFEHFLAQFPQIDRFISSVYGPQSANIEISFKPQYEKGSFPFYLKSLCESKSINLGSADWYIYGVGEGFNNSFDWVENANGMLSLYGYNFDRLMGYAEALKADLEKMQRVEWVFLNSRQNYMRSSKFEFLMAFDKDKILSQGISSAMAANFISRAASSENRILSIPEEHIFRNVYLVPSEKSAFNKWELFNSPINQAGGKLMKIKEFADIVRERTGSSIDKENMIYRINVEYSFIGNYTLQNLVSEAFVKQYAKILPIGYTIKSDRRSYWDEKSDDKTKLALIAFVIVVIFMLCAILFESLKQPLAIILMIPATFIGLFLTFGAFDLKYDLGGYSAFLLITGLTVNSAIYILDAQNHYLRMHRHFSGITLFIKAFRLKIVPIMLTILSTVFGLVPFLFDGPSEPFWFSLAVGTIGGLLFSVVAITLVLPVVSIRRPSLKQSLKTKYYE